jgi:predicted dehydrogenase
MGLVGPGFIAAQHIEAVRRLGYVDVIAIAGSSLGSAERKAEGYGVDRAYGSWAELIADPDIDVVHNTTPNHLHLSVSLAVLAAGKHVISDKPLALNADECRMLCEAAAKAAVVNAVTFNYRGNPLVQQMRAMLREQAVGRPVFIHGHYVQDWMTDEHVYSWRSDPAKGGRSSALADIGSHWCDLAEHVTGARITTVLADLATAVRTRYSAGGSAEAFAKSAEHGSAEKGSPVDVSGEDLGTVLLRWSDGARGSLTVGQVLPGHKNDLQIEVNGRTGSLLWNQERQNELWLGRHDEANRVLVKDPSLMLPEARRYAHLPGGHQEGWATAFTNVIADIYEWVREGGRSGAQRETVCTFAQAARTVKLVDRMLESHERGGVWVEVGPAEGAEVSA